MTGAASGLGRAITIDLAAHGWNITGVDVQEIALKSVIEEISHHGVRAHAIVGDLADPAFVTSAVRDAWAREPVTGLVNAAGIYPAVPFADLTAELWRRVQDVNVLAPVLATQALAQLAIAAGTTPAVVNVASGAATRARPGTAHYSTSKAAVVMATKATAIELSGAGIRVNAIAPGFFRVHSEVNPVTDEYADLLSQTVLPGPARPEHVTGPVRFLLSADAEWITGVTLPVDGGSSAGTNNLPQHWDAPTSWQHSRQPA